MLIVNPNNRIRTVKPDLPAIEPPLWAGLVASYRDALIIDAEAHDLTVEQTENLIRAIWHNKDVMIVVMGNNPSVSSTPKMPVAEALAERIKDLNVSFTGLHPIAVNYDKYPLVKTPFEGFPMQPWGKLPMHLYRAHNWHCLDGSSRSGYASIYTSLGCSFSCVAEKELVSMADRTSKPISKVRKGDKVLALNSKGELVSNIVLTAIQTAKSRDIITIKTATTKVSCTPDHKILTKRGWIEAGSLKVGDYVGEKVDRRTQSPTQTKDECLVVKPRQPTTSDAEDSAWGEPSDEESRQGCEGGEGIEREAQISYSNRTEQTCSNIEQGSTREKTTNNANCQSYEASRCSGKSKRINEIAFTTIKPTNETSLEEWANANSYNVPRGTCKGNYPNDCRQSNEEQTYSAKSCDASAMATSSQSKEFNREMGKKRGWCKQDRGEIRGYPVANGISFCGGREVLDRSVPEWEVQKPRLYLEKWSQQDRDSLQFDILAQPIELQRLRGDDRLSEYGVAHICHHRTDDEEFERVVLPDSGMAYWSKITSIEPSGTATVYDLETYPNHNFIAGNLVVHNCHYCNIHTLYGDRKVRFRPLKDIYHELDILAWEYNIKNIKIWDELFALKEDRVLAICEHMQHYNLNAWCYARLDTITEKMLKAMKRGGINWVAYGFESVTDPKFVKNTEDKIKMTKDAGIAIIANFMFGLPGTTQDDDKASLDFAMKHLFEFVNFYNALPYPGSQWYEDEKAKIPSGVVDDWKSFDQYEGVGLFRQYAFKTYFSNPDYHSMLSHRWGEQAVTRIKEMLAWQK